MKTSLPFMSNPPPIYPGWVWCLSWLNNPSWTEKALRQFISRSGQGKALARLILIVWSSADTPRILLYSVIGEMRSESSGSSAQKRSPLWAKVFKEGRIFPCRISSKIAGGFIEESRFVCEHQIQRNWSKAYRNGAASPFRENHQTKKRLFDPRS